MRDLLEFLGLVACIVGMALGITALLVALIEPRQCSARWPDASEWSFWGGCRVQTERGLIPSDMLRFNDIILRSAQ